MYPYIYIYIHVLYIHLLHKGHRDTRTQLISNRLIQGTPFPRGGFLYLRFCFAVFGLIMQEEDPRK